MRVNLTHYIRASQGINPHLLSDLMHGNSIRTNTQALKSRHAAPSLFVAYPKTSQAAAARSKGEVDRVSVDVLPCCKAPMPWRALGPCAFAL